MITYDEMLELASPRSWCSSFEKCRVCKNYGVVIHVRSSFNQNPGTLVVSEDKLVENVRVSGVTIKSEEARVTIPDVPDKPGMAAELFGNLSAADIIVDDSSVFSSKWKNTISFTISRKITKRCYTDFREIAKDQGTGKVDIDDKIAIVSAVGVGMKSHVGVVATMF